jgi:hypothetical protein
MGGVATKKKVKLKELKGSGYKCPVCREGNLVVIKAEKTFGNISIKFRTKDGIGFEFACDAKNDNFFLCKNQVCRARFERIDLPKKEEKIGAPCPIINCNGSLDSMKNVAVAKVYPKRGYEKVALTYGQSEPLFFKIVKGDLTYDEAGVCSKCHFVGPKEIDMR